MGGDPELHVDHTALGERRGNATAVEELPAAQVVAPGDGVAANAGAQAEARVERVVRHPSAPAGALDLVVVPRAGALDFGTGRKVHEVVDLSVEGGRLWVRDVRSFGTETAALVRIEHHAVACNRGEGMQEEQKEG